MPSERRRRRLPARARRLREDGSRAGLGEAGGYLALADAAYARDGDPRWQPIDRRQVTPVVLSRVGQAGAARRASLSLAVSARRDRDVVVRARVPAHAAHDRPGGIAAVGRLLRSPQRVRLLATPINGEGGKWAD